MADETPRVVLLGNTAPINSEREVQQLDDVDVDELREQLDDPDHPLARLTVDEERGLVGTHVKTPIDGVSVTRFVPPESMGLVEAVSTCLTVYAADHSNDPPEWVFCEAEPQIAEAIADHFRRQGNDCEVGIPDNWEAKRSLQPAGLRLIQEAKGEIPDELPPIAGGSVEWDEELAVDGMLDPWEVVKRELLRTNAGADFQSRVMADTASTGTGSYAAANYIALSTDATAPAAADTTLTAELVGSGLQRQQAAYAHTGGATTFTLTKTFTSSDGTTRQINKVGVFNAASVGTLVFETAVPSPPSLVSGDSLTITETVTM